jgi:hypothetical protein
MKLYKVALLTIRKTYCIVLLFLSINACQCGGQAEYHDKEKREDSVTYTGLSLIVDKPILKGNEHAFKVKLAFKEIHISNNTSPLKKFKLKAFISEEEGVKFEGSKLRYTDPTGKIESGTHIETYLPYNPINDIQIEIDHNQDVSKLIVTLEVYDENSPGDCRDKAIVTWIPSTPTLAFKGLSHLIRNNEEIDFAILNQGEELNTAGITLNVEVANGVQFKLNGKISRTVSLEEIWQSTNTFPKDASTNLIKLQLADAHGATKADITLKLMQGNKELTSQLIRWEHTLNLVLVGIKDIIGDENLNFTIHNQTKDILEDNTDKIILSIAATNGVKVSLNGKLAHEATLSHFLGEVQDLKKLQSTNPIELKVTDTHDQKEADITLTLTYKQQILDKRTVKWVNKVVELEFVDLNTTSITNDNEWEFKIKNNGVPVNLQEVIVHLKVTTTPGSTNTPDFKINGKTIPTNGIKLNELLDITSDVFNQHDITDIIKLKLDKGNTVKSSTLNLILKRNEQVWESPEISWVHKEIKLSLKDDLPSTKLKYGEPLTFKIKNEGDAINTNKIDLILSEINTVTSFQINNKIYPHTISSINLAELLPSENFILAQGQEVEIEIKREINHCFESIQEASFKLSLSSKDINIFTGLDAKQIIWEAKSVKFKLDANHLVLKGDQKDFSIEITAQSDAFDGLLELRIKKIKGDKASIPTLKDYKNNEGGYTCKFENLIINTGEKRYIKNLTIEPADPLHFSSITYEFELFYMNKKVSNSVQVTREAETLDLQLDIDNKFLKGDDQKITVKIINHGDYFSNIEEKVFLHITKVYGNAFIPELANLLNANGEYLYNLGEDFELEVKESTNLQLSIQPTEQIAAAYRFQLFYQDKELSNPIEVKWQPSIQLSVDKEVLKGNNQSFTVSILTSGDYPESEDIALHVEKLYGNVSIPKLNDFLNSSGVYVCGFKDLELKASGKADLELSIKPEERTAIAYKFQVFYKGKEISNAVKVEWKPKNISLQLVSRKILIGNGTSFKLDILNDGDELDDKQDEDKLSLKVKRIKGSEAKIFYKSFFGSPYQEVILKDNKNKLTIVELKKIIRGTYEFASIMIEPNGDTEAEFAFSLVYTCELGEDFYNVPLGNPVKFNWKEEL